MDGKAVQMTETATDAKDKLKELDPTGPTQIVEPTPDAPLVAACRSTLSRTDFQGMHAAIVLSIQLEIEGHITM